MNGKKAKMLRHMAYGNTAQTGKKRYVINEKGVIFVDGPRSMYQLSKELYKLAKKSGHHGLIKELLDDK